jgi:hypothetical protein
MANCGSRPKKMKYGGKVQKMAEGGAISNSDRKMLDKMIAEISEGTFVFPEARLKRLQKEKEKIPSGPIRMPKAIKNMRGRRVSKGGAGELSPSVTRYKNGGCVMSGRGGKFKGIS